MEIADEKFDEIVDDVWSQIPKNFQNKIENVSIVVESEPSRVNLREVGATGLLLGLFEGVPKTQWGSVHFGIQPSKITLFRENIKRVSKDMKDLRITIHVVLMHEVAHYFGYNEEHLYVMDKKLRRKLEGEDGEGE